MPVAKANMAGLESGESSVLVVYTFGKSGFGG
jgi:hypothetical protein